MLYSCTHMATVGIKVFNCSSPLLELLLSLVIIEFSLLLSLAHHKRRRNALHKFVSLTDVAPLTYNCDYNR